MKSLLIYYLVQLVYRKLQFNFSTYVCVQTNIHIWVQKFWWKKTKIFMETFLFHQKAMLLIFGFLTNFVNLMNLPATKIQWSGSSSIMGWVSFPTLKQCAADKTFHWVQDISTGKFQPQFLYPDFSTPRSEVTFQPGPRLFNHEPFKPEYIFHLWGFQPWFIQPWTFHLWTVHPQNQKIFLILRLLNCEPFKPGYFIHKFFNH